MSCHDEGQVLTERPAASIALVGSPNAGKTTLFNHLCGVRAKTANYPGVTVSRREAKVHLDNHDLVLVDLPGTYSLEPISPDEQVVLDSLHGRIEGVETPDALLVVIDATTLERSLLLVADVLALGKPTAVVLTMTDEVTARGGRLDLEALSRALGVPVVGVVGHRGVGLDAVRELLSTPESWPRPVLTPPEHGAQRAAWVESIVASAITVLQQDVRTRRIDAVLLHPVAGSVIFLATMLLVFQTVFTLAVPAMDMLDSLFVWLAEQVANVMPGLFGSFLADGIIGGVGGVLVFLPQIILLFLLLALLEKVGYLARAAFLADRVMGRFGLEGRSFISMLSAFACAVPAIMSTRSIPSDRRRLATMMSTPLMTCSARLPVYTLMIAAFIPAERTIGPFGAQGLTMLGLYLLGAVSGLVYAAILNLTALRSPVVPVLMELPPYRLPTLRSVGLFVFDGAWAFIRKAGTIILATTAVLWVLLNVPSVTPPADLNEAEAAGYQMEHSVAGQFGTALEPVFEPLGFNWQVNVAVISSLAAREVFVSTLAITTAAESEDALPDRLHELRDADGELVFTAPVVAAVLVFFVYALQCFATLAVLRRESNSWRWPLVAFSSMFALAYVMAFVAHTVVAAVA